MRVDPPLALRSRNWLLTAFLGRSGPGLSDMKGSWSGGGGGGGTAPALSSRKFEFGVLLSGAVHNEPSRCIQAWPQGMQRRALCPPCLADSLFQRKAEPVAPNAKKAAKDASASGGEEEEEEEDEHEEEEEEVVAPLRTAAPKLCRSILKVREAPREGCFR